MDIFLQQIINGLTLGSIYALVALGYTMVYGIIGLINFAHGEVVMMGAMVSLMVCRLLAQFTALPASMILISALLMAMLVCMALAWIMNRVAYQPLRRAPRLAPLITAIGVSIILQVVALLIWGRGYLSFPALIPISNYAVTAGESGAQITNLQIGIWLLTGVLMLTLLWLIHKTKLGIAMRATAQNPQVAGLMGIHVNKVIAVAFLIGAALAAVAGFMVGAYYGLAHYYMGFMLGLKAFTAAVLGGIGNIPGAMVGGLLLGLIEALGAGYIGQLTTITIDGQAMELLGSSYKDVFAFMVLILVLAFRPSGLLGERVGDRA